MNFAHDVCDEIEKILPIGKKEEIETLHHRIKQLMEENVLLRQQNTRTIGEPMVDKDGSPGQMQNILSRLTNIGTYGRMRA